MMTNACYAVIFISRLRADAEGYAETARRMMDLVREQPGFLGMESWRDETGRGVTISWWESEEAIARWRQHPRHRQAMRRGREEWYESFRVQICRVEREGCGS